MRESKRQPLTKFQDGVSKKCVTLTKQLRDQRFTEDEKKQDKQAWRVRNNAIFFAFSFFSDTSPV